MKNLNVRIVVWFLPAWIAAMAAAPAQSPAPVKLSAQITANYHKARNAAIKEVNQKYAQLSLGAMDLFVKENHQPRADEAKDWARRLGWTDDGGNFQGLTTDTKDRLGALQTLYLKQRANTVMAVDKTWLSLVEGTQKQAAQQGDQDGANVLAQLLVEMKKDMAGTVVIKPGQETAQASGPLTPAQKMVSDFAAARTAAVKAVNQKYAQLSLQTVDLFVKENNQPRADEAKAWARRLAYTDDVGNFRGMTMDTKDRLGALQTAYLKDRADAVAAVDKARLADLEATHEQVTPETDQKGAVGLVQTLDLIRHDLGITASASQEGSASTSSVPPAGRPPAGSSSTNPFGIQTNKSNP